jgi:hypothetical protein
LVGHGFEEGVHEVKEREVGEGPWRREIGMGRGM